MQRMVSLLVWHLTIFLAYMVKGLAGFGNSLIHTGIMAFFQDNAVITPVDLILTFPANVTLVYKHRRFLQKRIILPVTLVVLLALIPGSLLLKTMDSRLIKCMFGVLVIVLGLDMLRTKAKNTDANKVLTWFLVGLSGIVSGMFGVGALLAAALGRMCHDSRELKANMAAVFVAENLGRVVIYAWTGLLTLERIGTAFKLYPAMLLGLFVGMRCAGKLKEQTVRICVVIVLVLSGIMLIVNNL